MVYKHSYNMYTHIIFKIMKNKIIISKRFIFCYIKLTGYTNTKCCMNIHW